jgi:rod shape-determining protein MreC
MTLLARPLRVARFLHLARGASGRIMALELRVAALVVGSRENLRLRAMLGYRPPEGFLPRPAHIVGLDLDPLRGVGWIDLGRSEGIRGGEAVVTVDGLVGVVGEAHAGGALLRLLRNADVAVGVRDTRSREVGILVWEPSGRRFRVENVPRSADMAVGDTLLTSGLGGVFPGHLSVGRITEVRESGERLLKEIRVEPFTAFSRLEEVFVLVPLGVPSASRADTSRGEER